MNPAQRQAVGTAAYLIAAILLFIFFVRPFWQWATWNEAKHTLDLGFLKVSTRPPFPSDAKSVVVGLVLPIALAAYGRIVQSGGRE